MDQNSKNVTTKITIRLQGKALKLAFGLKQTWNLALIIGLIQLALWLFRELS